MFDDYNQQGYNCDVVNVMGKETMDGTMSFAKQWTLSQEICQKDTLQTQQILACARNEAQGLIFQVLLEKFGFVALHHAQISLDGHFLLRAANRVDVYHIQCGKMLFKFVDEGSKCTNFRRILLSNGTVAFYDPVDHIITSLSTPIPCSSKTNLGLGDIFKVDLMESLTKKMISLAALKKIPPSISLSNILNKEAVRALIHEEELELEDGDENLAAYNEAWRKWSPRLSMFSLGVSFTFLVGVFIAARYSKLNILRTLALMNGFAKTVYDFLKFRKEQKAELEGTEKA